jgi:hypothetical protein
MRERLAEGFEIRPREAGSRPGRLRIVFGDLHPLLALWDRRQAAPATSLLAIVSVGSETHDSLEWCVREDWIPACNECESSPWT